MNIKEVKSIYFLGIGGIGMSAIARYFNEHGVIVFGYDRTPTKLTQKLIEEGIQITFEDSIDTLTKDVSLVIYTPAIPTTNLQLNWYRENGFPVYKRSDVLQWITESLYSITVAGTHGKTTTSTLIAYLLQSTGIGCNAFLGGISVNYGKNYWGSEHNVAVIEADEFDRSFLKLSPDVAVLTSMDPDHLDIYQNKESVEEAFIQYTRNVKSNGYLFVKYGLNRIDDLSVSQKLTYGVNVDEADIKTINLRNHNGGYMFDFISPFGNIKDVVFPIGGLHNVENATVAIAIGLLSGIKAEQLKESIIDFKGIKRRFEYIIHDDNLVFIDDYAHHPTELTALIESAKRLNPNKKTLVVFQPHLFSRTRDFADGFAESLDLADEVILLDIYPARELPIDGVSSEMILEKMTIEKKCILSNEALIETLEHKSIELLITAGAGNIDQLIEPIKKILIKN